MGFTLARMAVTGSCAQQLPPERVSGHTPPEKHIAPPAVRIEEVCSGLADPGRAAEPFAAALAPYAATVAVVTSDHGPLLPCVLIQRSM